MIISDMQKQKTSSDSLSSIRTSIHRSLLDHCINYILWNFSYRFYHQNRIFVKVK